MASSTRQAASPAVDVETPQGTILTSAYVRKVKPVLDRIAAAVALLVLLPVFAVVAIAVYTSLGAPIIFGQRRVGLGGRTFTVYKFRSMEQDRRDAGRAYDGFDRRVTHKSETDPRLTPTGRLIRRLSLDELPQLINVLKGDMSLVGPRPELPGIVEEHYVDWMHRRHAVRPGMTGLWQVSERGNGMMHEHVDVDLDYVDEVSLGSDLRILARTLPAALGSNQGV